MSSDLEKIGDEVRRDLPISMRTLDSCGRVTFRSDGPRALHLEDSTVVTESHEAVTTLAHVTRVTGE